jgi:hypothetical protein
VDKGEVPVEIPEVYAPPPAAPSPAVEVIVRKGHRLEHVPAAARYGVEDEDFEDLTATPEAPEAPEAEEKPAGTEAEAEVEKS